MKCPTCNQDVLHNGTQYLNPQKSRIGRHLPDGTQTTIQDLRNGIRAHHPHHCPPQPTTPTPEQDPLF